MALGNIIGSGIFLASGTVISISGPAAIVAYAFGGFIMLLEVMFITEMSIVNPAPGSFRVHITEVFGPGMGFVNGWMFWCSGMLGMAGEVTAAAIFTAFWFPKIPLWVFCLIYAAVMAVLNLQDTRGLGRMETFLASLKVLTLVVLAIYGFLAITGAINADVPGRASFYSAAAFLPNGLKGLAGSLLLVLFSFTGTGIIGMAVADTRNPEKDLPPAIYIISAIVTGLYVLAILFIVLLLPLKSISTSVSPFVLIANKAGIPYGGALLNIIMLTSALAALNSAMYSASRMLYSLSIGGQAPRAFQKLSNKNVPVYAVGTSSFFLLLAALLSYIFPGKVFIILTGASGFTAMFNWLMISFAHLFYRKRTLRLHPDKLKYKVPGYPYITILAIFIIVLILLSTLLYKDQISSLIGGVMLITFLVVLYSVLRLLKILK